MTTDCPRRPCRCLERAGSSAARFRPAVARVRRAASVVTASVCLVACAALPPARMALPTALEATTPLAFDGLGGGRSGSFALEGQVVTYRRMGDALSVFDSLRVDRLSVEFERAGAQGRCDGRAAAVTRGIVDIPAQPLALSCRFTGSIAGELLLNEARLASAGTRQAREGQARFGAVVIDIRSEHALAGSPLPLPQPAGYRLLIQGRDVAALDLAGGTPVLRRTADLDEATLAAVWQVALALGLLYEPAVTRD